MNSKNTAKLWRMTKPKKNLRDYNTGLTQDRLCPHKPHDSLMMPPPDLDDAFLTEPQDWQHFVVPDDYAGLRLDQALVKLFPEYSRSRLQDWIVQQQVQVNDAPAISKQKVWGGERLTVLPQAHPTEQPDLAEHIPLTIVYEDDAIMIINKPVGLVVHPGSGNWQGTLLNGLLYYAPQLSDVPRAGIVHRLDKDTSGLMVVAKTLAAQTALVRQLEARSVKREYLALVYGELSKSGKVDAPIGRHPSQRVKMAVVADGKPAITHYHPEAEFPGCTLVRCRLETGRTHQIRVHMTHIKHPLIGDGVYLTGPQKCPPSLRAVLTTFPRQALHATRLALVHPVTGEAMEWHVPMPADMQQLLSDIREVLHEPT